MEILQHTLAFIFALALLITFHEYGHFWVARRCGVKILRFSVGFGKPLYKRVFGEDKSEFVIAAIPLGGYVKMLDEREANVEPEELPRAFNRKPLGQRFAIVFAGPLFNFIFAIFAYWLVFMVGITGYKPIIGKVVEDSIAHQSGLEIGQEIIAIDGVRTRTWASVMDRAVSKLLESGSMQFTVRDENMSEATKTVDVSAISIDDIAGGKFMAELGIGPEQIKLLAKIKRVIDGGAAARAGMKNGDEIIRVEGEEMNYWDDWVDIVRSHPEQQIQVEVLRGGERIELLVRPEGVTEEAKLVGKVGVEVDYPEEVDESKLATESYAPLPAFQKGLEKTWDVSIMSLRVMGKMITGEASVKNLSGPISIAQYAGYTAAAGFAIYISFLAVVSVSLGLLNLFPIPILDGGHLMYYLIELVKGSPVSDSTQLVGQQVGLAVLLGLMSLVFYNDIVRLVG